MFGANGGVFVFFAVRDTWELAWRAQSRLMFTTACLNFFQNLYDLVWIAADRRAEWDPPLPLVLYFEPSH